MARLLPALSLLALPLVLSACVVVGEPPAPPLAGADACGASGYQGLVGQSRRVLHAMRLPERTRIIEPGMPVTEDYAAGRLNIWISTQGRIERVTCG